MTAPRNEVLSQEEAAFVEERRVCPRFPEDRWAAIVSRLVSRIESDAARSAALRRVAEEAALFRAAYRFYIDDEDVELPDSGHRLDAALADLDRLTKEAT